MNSEATAPPPPEGDASEQEISVSKDTFNDEPIMQVVARISTISSKEDRLGFWWLPLMRAPRSSKSASMMLKRGRRKHIPNVAFPIKCLSSNSFQESNERRAEPRPSKSTCLSPASLYHPAEPSKTPPCKVPRVAATTLFAWLRGKPLRSQSFLNLMCLADSSPSSASAHWVSSRLSSS